MTAPHRHDANPDAIDPATVPTAPLGAFKPSHWLEVPKGFYAVPVHDWNKFGDDCGVDEDAPTPALDLLGFRLCSRHTPVHVKNGPRAGATIGRDSFKIGPRVLARGVQPRIIRTGHADGTITAVRYTPSDRLRRECESDRFCAEHVYREDSTAPKGCPCANCTGPDGAWYRAHWRAADDQRSAYANEIAAAIIYSIEKEDDAFRKLYGLLTGRCGRCGRLLTDPKSKTLGVGPDCRGSR